MIGKVLGPLGFVILFNVAAIGVLLMIPPWLGIAWVLLLGGLFLWWHVRRTPELAGPPVRIPLRAPASSLAWVAIACGSSLLCLFGIAGLISVLGQPLSPEELRGYEVLTNYQKTLPGWIAFTTLIALVIPIVEEFNFRGRIQHALHQKWGLAVALAVTSALFAIMHMGAPRSAILLIPLTLGLANGVAVVVFKSIWVPVATHTLWNGSMAVLGALKSGAVSSPARPAGGEQLVASAVVLGLGALGWLLCVRYRQPVAD